MFRNTYDWAVMNRGRFGEMSFAYAAGFLWVMTLLTIGALLSFAQLTGFSFSELSVLPRPLAGFVPQLTADTAGFSAFIVAFLGACVFAPFIEEGFRAAVLQALCEKKDRSMKNFFVILALSVFLFGILHGGYVNIFIQGVIGLLLARLWFNVGKDYRWRYLSMVAVHAAYNFTIIGIQLMVLKAVN